MSFELLRDPLLYQTPDGGEINIEGGIVETTDGLETAGYLSLVGGNESGTWWGDSIQPSSEFKYPSRFSKVLDGTPAVPRNLVKIEEAAKNDLSELPQSGVSVVASLTGVNEVTVVAEVEGSTMEFTENWEAMRGDN